MGFPNFLRHFESGYLYTVAGAWSDSLGLAVSRATTRPFECDSPSFSIGVRSSISYPVSYML